MEMALGDTLGVVGLGMGVVFSTLIGLFLLMTVASALAKRIEVALDERKRRAQIQKEEQVALTRRGTNGAHGRDDSLGVKKDTDLDPVLLAVISAAVAVTFGPRARIRQVNFLEQQVDSGGWGRQGRQDIMNNHHE